jgi:hypothetical protein
MEHLRVYKCPVQKVRVGKENDGGYVIAEIDPDYDFFLSGGIGDDISFEKALLEKYPTLSCHAFDGTLKHTMPPIDRLKYINQNVGAVETEQVTTLRSYFNTYSNMFIKMDVEGGEVPLFYVLSDNDLLKIKQLVIEFHSANEVIIPTRLAKTHWLVHFHPNNACGVTSVDGIKVPNVFECTYIRKNEGEDFPLNQCLVPDPELDERNDTRNPEIILNCEPYMTL